MKNKPYLITIDLDGTTLCDDKTIHPITIEMIQKAKECGHIIVISTGRPFYSSSRYYHELKLNSPIVNRNGAHIHHPYLESFDLSYYIDEVLTSKIINNPYENFIKESYIEVKRDIYVSKGDFSFFKGKNFQFERIYVEKPQKPITMATLLVDNEYVDQITDYFNELNLDAYPWRHHGEYESTMIEIFPKGVDKVKAIDHLCEYFNIPHERTIAIGDEVNDIGMIQYANLGVTLKNANPIVKKEANLVLDYSNNEGAVGLFLKDFFHLDQQ